MMAGPARIARFQTPLLGSPCTYRECPYDGGACGRHVKKR